VHVIRAVAGRHAIACFYLRFDACTDKPCTAWLSGRGSMRSISRLRSPNFNQLDYLKHAFPCVRAPIGLQYRVGPF